MTNLYFYMLELVVLTCSAYNQSPIGQDQRNWVTKQQGTYYDVIMNHVL